MAAELAYAPVTEQLIDELCGVVGDRLSTAAAVREHHGNGEDYFDAVPPDAVVFAQSTEEVSEIVKICSKQIWLSQRLDFRSIPML